jgi:hypothetical protein
MFKFWFGKRPEQTAVGEELSQDSALVQALNRSQAVIEFALDGTVVGAN